MWFIEQWAQASVRADFDDLPDTANLVADTADFSDLCERIKGR